MKNYEFVIVDVNGNFASVWTVCDADSALEELEKAKKSAAKSVATYTSHIKNYPANADYWRKCRDEYKNARYEIMTFGEFLERQKQIMTGGEVQETTAECFEDL